MWMEELEEVTYYYVLYSKMSRIMTYFLRRIMYISLHFIFSELRFGLRLIVKSWSRLELIVNRENMASSTAALCVDKKKGL